MGKRFRKTRPDGFRVPSVPLTAYDKMGGIEENGCALLVLGWLRGGAVVTEPKSVLTPKGPVEIDMMQVWGSMTSMQEDLLAAVGHRFTRPQIKYAISKLMAAGLVEDLGLVHPETRGKYGKLYALAPDLFDSEQPHVDIVDGYNMFYRGDPRDFKLGEIVVGNLKYGARKVGGKWGYAEVWVDQVAREGLDDAAFTTIGRWRQGEEGRTDVPVFIPYFTIDIDRREIMDALADTIEVCKRLRKQGFDMDRVYVSFSGSKGFHVQISADQVGCPIFSDSVAAAEMARRLADSVCYGMERDKGVDTPKSLIRVTGSTHEKTGMRKFTWTAARFQMLSVEEMMAEMDTFYRGFDFPSPYDGDMVDAIANKFIGMARYAAKKLYDDMQKKRRAGDKAGSVIRAAVAGVEQGVEWHPEKPPSREWAAYDLACWLYEGKTTGDHEIDAALERGGPEFAMEAWNERNSPPLTPSEMKGRLASARRTVL